MYASPHIFRIIKSRRMRWAGHIALMGEAKNAYKFWSENLKGKKLLGRPRCRWEYNIKINTW
jgi:hypothetical protein